MALRGLAYSVRMAAYNTDGERVSGLASTITATLWADGTTTVLSGVAITEIGNTGVYVVPLTAEQMTAYNLCVTAVSSTAGITFDPVYLDTDAGRVDTSIGSRLATSGYTTPPTVTAIQNGLAKSNEIPTTSEIANATVPLMLGTSISSVTDVAVGSLGTLILGRLASRIDGNEQVIYKLDGTTEHTRLTVIPATEDIPDIAGILPESGSSSE